MKRMVLIALAASLMTAAPTFAQTNDEGADVETVGEAGTPLAFGAAFADRDFATLPKLVRPSGELMRSFNEPMFGVLYGQDTNFAFIDQNSSFGPGLNVISRETDTGAQFLAGLAYDISASSAVTLDGRYQSDFGVTSKLRGLTGSRSGIFNDDDDEVSVNLGVRIDF